METRSQLNFHAPIFVPGQPRGMINQSILSQSKPLIVYGDLDRHGRSVSRSTGQLTSSGINMDWQTAQMPPKVGDLRGTNKLPEPHLACQKLQTLIDARRYARPEVDNTERASEARFYFDLFFGYNVNNLQVWQDICFLCGRSPEAMPKTIRNCKRFLSTIYVNIFDLVDAARAYRTAEPQFSNARDLGIYSRQTGKICPAAAAEGNELLRYMLRKWF